YSDRVSFAFVDATDGKRETAEYASRWLRNNGYSFPGYYDADGEAMYTYGIAGLPTTVVVSGEGEIITVSSGMIDPIALRKLLDSLV
ncbi:MAG: TlpA family protein disulfide reductase, partial [Atopobiaceae bacterium]|nr:TlpA family protein disulfide reductase [Atopobiaceae bacterium]